MHKVKPKQKVRIIQLEIAVPSDVDCADEISALLSENGIANEDSDILDWRYTGNTWDVRASSDPEENEIFHQPRT